MKVSGVMVHEEARGERFKFYTSRESSGCFVMLWLVILIYIYDAVMEYIIEAHLQPSSISIIFSVRT